MATAVIEIIIASTIKKEEELVAAEKQTENEHYFQNANNYEGQTYYGLIGGYYRDSNREDSVNLIVSKVLGPVIQMIDKEYHKYQSNRTPKNGTKRYEYMVFYKIKNQNPYIFSLNILSKLSDCHYITIIKNYCLNIKKIHLNFDQCINITDYINRIKEIKNSSVPDKNLWSVIYNRITNIQHDIILSVLKQKLILLTRKTLKSMCKDINIEIKWYQFNCHIVAELLTFLKINVLDNSSF